MSSRILSAISLLALLTSPLQAQEHEPVNLLEPHSGLIFWTILVFIATMLLLRKLAFGPILAAVRSREQSLTDAIVAAENDRNEAKRLLAEQRAAIEAARAEAQRYIADGRATAESMRGEMLEQTRLQQAELLDRARKEIEGEKVKAVEEIRREAVDLALAGAGKLIGQRLDAASDRKLVEQYLNSLGRN